MLGEVDEKSDIIDRAKLEKIKKRVSVESMGDRSIKLTFTSAKDRKKVDRDWLRRFFPSMREDRDATPDETKILVTTMRDDRVEQDQSEAVQQVSERINERVNQLGIGQADVSSRENFVIVEVPGAREEDFDRVRRIVAKTAQLEFKICDDDTDFVGTVGQETLDAASIERYPEQAPTGTNKTNRVSYLAYRGPEETKKGDQSTRQKFEAFLDTLAVPPDHQLLVSEIDPVYDPKYGGDRRPSAEIAYRTYYLWKAADVTGEDVDDAQVQFDQKDNSPNVGVTLTGAGGRKFSEVTGRNVKRRMAVVLDDKVASAPVIESRLGSSFRITLGQGSNAKLQEEAKDLVVTLKAGALPAPIHPANEQVVGPTLGIDAVKSGLKGAAIGVGFVLLFMLLYYQVAGAVADLMVLLNLLLLIGIMAGLGAPLTLPGVASIALTVGMAVDANVLITERIREELRLGKSPRSAVDHGFKRAFWSVFDAQLTTFFAGVVLYQFGTGPIKGFATMLMIGIATSLFTGIFCSRVLFDWIVRGLGVKRLMVG